LKAQQDVERLTPLVQADAASKQDLDAAAAAAAGEPGRTGPAHVHLGHDR
jgi:multidrug resistance efflux pump